MRLLGVVVDEDQETFFVPRGGVVDCLRCGSWRSAVESLEGCLGYMCVPMYVCMQVTGLLFTEANNDDDAVALSKRSFRLDSED